MTPPASPLPETVATKACRWCGFLQAVPPHSSLSPGENARCARCGAVIDHVGDTRTLDRAAAFALAALVMYPAAMILPVLEIRKLGHTRSSTIWSGTVELLAEGQMFVGVVVFLCSVVIPLVKIFGILWLWHTVRGRDGGFIRISPHTRALAFRAIDWIGRWGMLDVLLVAVLVAAVKLGDWMDVAPGPGVAAYAAVVIFSLLASATFNPHALWEDQHDR